MFPPGLPGVGLLLLRVSVAVALLFEHYACRGSPSTWTLAAPLLISLAFSLGYLTPVATVAGLLLHGLVWFQFGVINAAFAVIVSLDLIALVLLGPGAYSLDGYRFGRRRVVLPH